MLDGMSDYSRIKDRKSPLKGSRPSVPHGTYFLELELGNCVYAVAAGDDGETGSEIRRRRQHTELPTAASFVSSAAAAVDGPVAPAATAADPAAAIIVIIIIIIGDDWKR